MRPVEKIVLHCSATSPEATVESIKRYWREVMKWNSPGYHYIIDAAGNRHILESIENITNGVKGHNADSIHICYIGGIDDKGRAKDTRTGEQKFETECLIRELLDILPCRPEILGHRDLSPDKNGNGIIESHEWLKECPSFDVKSWLIEIGLE